jgi:tetratricopeptide (TPR) repeat protein
MPSQNNRPARPAARDSSGNIFIVGIICLAAGLGIGYYFGKTAGSSALPVVSSAPPQSSIMDPTAFLQSEATYKSMLSSNPRDLNALIQLGNLYYDNSRFSEAVEYYGKALEIDPNNVAVRTDRGTCYWSLSQPDPAIGEFQKSLLVNPSHPQTLFNMGIVYLHGKNDAAEARRAWEKLLATNPNYPDRARLEQMLVSLSTPAAPPVENPAGATPAAPAAGQTNAGSQSVED